MMLSAGSLRLTAAQYALGLVGGEELIECAGTLLDRGIYTYSLGELWTAPTSALRDIGPLFEAALRELNYPLLAREEAARVLLWYHVVDIAEGTCTPREWLPLCRQVYSSLQFDPVTAHVPEFRKVI